MTKLPSDVRKALIVHKNHSRGIIEIVLGLMKAPSSIISPKMYFFGYEVFIQFS